MRETQSELVIFLSCEIHIRSAILNVHGCGLRARIAQGKFWKHDNCVRDHAQRRAVFKFTFSASVSIRAQLHALGNRHVQKRLLESLASVAVRSRGAMY